MSEPEQLEYQSGFGNQFSSEALEGALPEHQNNPQVCPYGLYAEQISGTAFTAPRRENQRSWLYRMRPSVCHGTFRLHNAPPKEWGEVYDFVTADFDPLFFATPNQIRWGPLSTAEDNFDNAAEEPRIAALNTDFVDGLRTMCGAGHPSRKDGYGIHIYGCSISMKQRCFSSADGDLLIVPQEGTLLFWTEMGRIRAVPGEIVVIQRGIKFKVELVACEAARGYILEVFNGHFTLPDLGPLGANGLANPRDFQTPIAAFEGGLNGSADSTKGGLSYEVVTKFNGRLFTANQEFTPFNVVAWHGNYAPYKYDLAHFCPVNTVSYDHSDPSIFTVLTCPSAIPGTSAADFVIFPPRWAVAENTFRPPYYHRNTMSEFMGLIRGEYDGKKFGFAPGGASLHSCMSPHGPDTDTFLAASSSTLEPRRIPDSTLAFMFEVNYIPQLSKWAATTAFRDWDYRQCWQGLQSYFDGSRKGKGFESKTQNKKPIVEAQEQGPA